MTVTAQFPLVAKQGAGPTVKAVTAIINELAASKFTPSGCLRVVAEVSLLEVSADRLALDNMELMDELDDKGDGNG